ncbi:MAG: hypothetical protein JWO71_1727 [Candidatus Acidoferrum typicum]|nr:hypothetical protein [Candidatus Acidoferrum typicum]
MEAMIEKENAEKRMDEIMGRLLRTGVILAAVFVLAGGAVYMAQHPTPVTDYRVFQGEPAELRTVSGIFHEALALHGPGLIQFGLLILIATPIARVAFSVVAFLYQRDWTYVMVTLVVLSLLFYSLLGAGG